MSNNRIDSFDELELSIITKSRKIKKNTAAILKIYFAKLIFDFIPVFTSLFGVDYF